MPKEQLGNRIQELLDELEKVEPADPAARDRLAQVLDDIRTMVDESELESGEHESLRERFDVPRGYVAVERFEAMAELCATRRFANSEARSMNRDPCMRGPAVCRFVAA